MPLMEVVLEQQYFNQQIIDRFNYMASGTPAAVSLSFGLMSALGGVPASSALPADTLFATLANLQNTAVHFIQTTVRAVYLDEDFYGNPFFAGTDGLQSGNGDPMSPVSAWGFRSNRVKQSIRRGYKRFVGVSEGDMAAGGLVTIGAGARAELVRVALGETITFDDEGNTLTFVPCIVSKQKYTTPSGKEAYKYYSSEVLQAPHIASGVSWEIYNTMRTQNSRQYGKGS